MSDVFLSVDVETANSSRASICEIGIVAFAGGLESWRWTTLVNPSEPFDSSFVGRYHFVDPSMTLHAPEFPVVLGSLESTLQGQVVVTWSSFDQGAFSQAAEKYGRCLPAIRWLDAMQVARQVWPHLPNHGLSTVTDYLQLSYRPHVAVEDAWACGMALQAAMAMSRRGLDDWLIQVPGGATARYMGPPKVSYQQEVRREGMPECVLSGHVALFTGAFVIGKLALGEIAAQLGSAVTTNWSKRVTILVVAADPGDVGVDGKSSKLLAAEAAQSRGANVTIWSEAEFLAFARANGMHQP